MTPTLFVEFGSEALRWPWCRFFVARIAPGTGSAGGATSAGVLAFPWSIGMTFTNPAAVLANQASHQCRVPACAAVMCGIWMTVCSRRWLSKVSPQGHVISELGICDGIRSPAAHIAYLRSVHAS
jgi:hypothetical protein